MLKISKAHYYFLIKMPNNNYLFAFLSRKISFSGWIICMINFAVCQLKIVRENVNSVIFSFKQIFDRFQKYLHTHIMRHNPETTQTALLTLLYEYESYMNVIYYN